MNDKLPSLQQDKFYEFKPFRVPKYQIRFEKADRLSRIQGYSWYTPASIYLWGRFSDINLSDIVQQSDIKVFWYKFEKPLFRGFDIGSDPGWNHILWAARDDQWNTLIDRILESVQFDIENKILYQYALQVISICDPLFADLNTVLPANFPTIDVHAFAVMSNKGQCAFDKKKQEAHPRMVTFKPDQLHVKAALKLFRDKNLTQDKAFERIKRILAAEQDTEHMQRLKNYERRS